MESTNLDYNEINDMAIFNNDVYIVGSSNTIISSGDISKAVVLKNGVIVPELSKVNAIFESIFITK